MRISFSGLTLTEGKVKYNDSRLSKIAEKIPSQKSTPLFFEFIPDNYGASDAIIILKDRILDLLILDMERLESRLERTDQGPQINLFKKCLSALEKESALCDLELEVSELEPLRQIDLLSLKPVVVEDNPDIEPDAAIRKVLDKAGCIIFYTANKKETRAWVVKKGADIVQAAARIHTDLARGFIRAEVVNFDDFADVHNINEAKSKGLVKTVGKDYKVGEADIIEIKFNV